MSKFDISISPASSVVKNEPGVPSLLLAFTDICSDCCCLPIPVTLKSPSGKKKYLGSGDPQHHGKDDRWSSLNLSYLCRRYIHQNGIYKATAHVQVLSQC